MHDDAEQLEPKTVRIQWVDDDPGPCTCCGGKVGSGPVGYTTTPPLGVLCDGCLLAANKDLGMLLILGCANRELAQFDSELDACESMATLMVLAKIYDRGAMWPRRPLSIFEFVGQLLGAVSKISLGNLEQMLRNEVN